MQNPKYARASLKKHYSSRNITMSCNLQVDFIGQSLWKWFPTFYEILLKQAMISLITVIIALIVLYIIGHFVISAYLNAVCLLYYLRHGNVDNSQAIEKTSTLRKSLCASEQSERAWKIFAFCTFQKSYFFHYFCLYLFVGIITFLLVSYAISVHSMQFPFYYSRHDTINAP